ncbi:hypothetical protein [Campylobacter majalis]|uniref:hypothetical protein n=1 Tax=Campylobacter majalis TaxID=2790656 RepID=UPI003D68B4CA
MDNVGSYKDSAKSINHWRDYWDSKKLEYPYPDDLNDPFNFDSCKKGYFEINLDRFRVIDMSGINKDNFIGWNGPTIKDSLEDLLGGTIWRVKGDKDSVSEIVSDFTPTIDDLRYLIHRLQMDPCEKDIQSAISSSEVCSVFSSRFGYTDFNIDNDVSDFRKRSFVVKN